ncbi:MAG: glycosyltransferase family 2 protein [Nitrospirae bacterium]|nr:glycosyltransferase family 2 protein [Fimbriimonadaceae bacterium]
MAELSILIVNWNTRDLLRACLTSLREHPYVDDEIIVVDNASSDASAEMVRTEFPEVRLIEPGANTGYAKGNNLAFSAAESPYLLTLNPDTQVFEGTLAGALASLKGRPSHGYLGAKLISPDGSTQASVRGFPTFLGLLGDWTGLGARLAGPLDSYRLTRFDYDGPQSAPQPMGTFLLFRREALEDVGTAESPFDEAFPIFFNEVDLLKRLHEAGWSGWYDPAVRVMHHHGASTRQVRKAMIWESHRSLVRYLTKHAPHPLANVGYRVLALLIYLAALIRARGIHAGFRP